MEVLLSSFKPVMDGAEWSGDVGEVGRWEVYTEYLKDGSVLGMVGAS